MHISDWSSDVCSSDLLEGEIVLSLVEQYFTDPKIISIVGDRSRLQYERINYPQPDGTVLNDITASAAQYVISEQAWRQTLQQAAFESLMQLLGQLSTIAPQAVPAMLASVQIGSASCRARVGK